MFEYKRKFSVDDLFSIKSLIKNTSVIEFASFEDFIYSVVQNRYLQLNGFVDKIIVPIEEPIQIECLMKIIPEVIPFLIVYLKCFSKEALDSFKPRKDTALMVDSNNVLALKQSIKTCKSDNFAQFCLQSYGYFRDEIDASNVKDVLNIYTDPFFEFPFFCIADIRWDFNSLNDNLSLETLNQIQYFGNDLKFNMINTKSGSLDWRAFCSDLKGDLTRPYRFDLMRYNSPKHLFVKGHTLYVGDKPIQKSGVDVCDGIDKSISSKELDHIRRFYDVEFNNTCGLTDYTFMSLYQNYKCCGDPNMIPYLTYFVTRAFNGEHI